MRATIGAASDKVGTAPVLLQSLPAIILSRVLLGITEAVIYTNVNTLMGDYFKGEPRRKWLAYQNAIGSLLATVLIIAGGSLGAVTWRGPFLLYLLALPIFIAAVLLTWEPAPQGLDTPADMVPAVSQASRAAPNAAPAASAASPVVPGAAPTLSDAAPIVAPAQFPWRIMLMVCAVTLVSAVIFFLQPLQTGVVMNAIGSGRPDVIGIVSAGTGFALPFGAWLFGRSKRLRFGQFLTLAYALFAAGLFILGSSAHLPGVILGACIAQFACGITFPLLNTWCQSKLQFEVRARGMGMWISTFFVGQFLSTSTVALLTAPAGGIGGVMRWAGLFCIPVAVLAWLADRTSKRPTAAL